MSTLDLTLGALEIGTLISSVLYGIATVQCFIYTERTLRDPNWLRAAVGLVWIVESVHTVFTWILLYSYTVTNYGRPETIIGAPWPLAMIIPLTSFVGSAVQIFFAWRVRVLSGRLIIPLVSWSGAVVRFGFGITLAVVVFKSRTVPNFFLHYDWLVNAQLILDAVVDILNTISLCYYLIRRRTGFKATQRIVDKLIMYTVETGLITSLCAVAVLACSHAMQDNLVFLAIFIVYPKLFSNSLLTSLNARQNLRQTSHGGSDTTAGWSTGIFNDQQPGFASDIENRSLALELEPSQHHSSKTMSARTSLPPSSFEKVTADAAIL